MLTPWSCIWVSQKLYTDEDVTDHIPVDSAGLAHSRMKSDQLETTLDEQLFEKRKTMVKKGA